VWTGSYIRASRRSTSLSLSSVQLFNSVDLSSAILPHIIACSAHDAVNARCQPRDAIANLVARCGVENCNGDARAASRLMACVGDIRSAQLSSNGSKIRVGSEALCLLVPHQRRISLRTF
jgi:hypothetical protein